VLHRAKRNKAFEDCRFAGRWFWGTIATPMDLGPGSYASHAHRRGNGSKRPNQDADGRTSIAVVGLDSSGALPLLALLAAQDEKLGIGREHLAYGILKFASGRDAPLDLLRPIAGDALDLWLTLGRHEVQGPSFMTLVVRAMAAGIPAPREAPSDASGQQIGQDGETAEQLKFALAET